MLSLSLSLLDFAAAAADRIIIGGGVRANAYPRAMQYIHTAHTYALTINSPGAQLRTRCSAASEHAGVMRIIVAAPFVTS